MEQCGLKMTFSFYPHVICFLRALPPLAAGQGWSLCDYRGTTFDIELPSFGVGEPRSGSSQIIRERDFSPRYLRLFSIYSALFFIN